MALLAPWFALLLPLLTLCRTTFSNLASLERRSTVSGSLAGFVVSQTNKSLVANPAENQTVDTDLEEIEYDIPNTSRYVSIVIDKSEPLDPSSFYMVIWTALSQLNGHIAIHGDAPLQPRDNPYKVIRGGCNSTTESYHLQFDDPPYLTYKILLETFIGLKVILGDENQYFLAEYSIYNATRIIYGHGTIDKTTHAAGVAAMSVKTEK